jgi:hypothetical protein
MMTNMNRWLAEQHATSYRNLIELLAQLALYQSGYTTSCGGLPEQDAQAISIMPNFASNSGHQDALPPSAQMPLRRNIAG